MPQIILTQGLPASGKSFWANKFLKEHPEYRNVNRDDLRVMLHGTPYKFTKQREKDVTTAQFALVDQFLERGNSVIVSDTNLNPKVVSKWRQVAHDHNIPLTFKDFTDVSPQECIKRDLVRPNSVGSDVIMRMYTDYLKLKIVWYKGTPGAPSAYLCDLDGTAALMDGKRSPFEWDKVDGDIVNVPVRDAITALAKDHVIIYLSGRDGVCYNKTKKWLEDNGFPEGDLLMRQADDMRKDTIVKKELFATIEHQYDIKGVFDDRPSVCDMWRDIGIFTFQVADPNMKF